MEFFDKTKTILFNPKEEWTVIEVEDKSHLKVLIEHLLILALIPVIAILVGYLLSQDYEFKLGIIKALSQFIMIVVGSYGTAVIINIFADQFGSSRDFNRTFSLVAYSYTPLGVAGLLYFYVPIAWLAPYLGLYGFYLLYLGIDSQLKPVSSKKTLCFIFSLIVMLAIWVILTKLTMEITNSIMQNEITNSFNK